GALHAFNNVLIEEALAAADEVDRRVAAGDDPGPLAGVPVALKDNLCTRGVATTCSSRILEGWRPPYDATVVARLRGAGAVQIGPFAATVEDAALTLEVIGGHDPCDSTSIAEPAPSLAAVLSDGVEGLRVGVVRELTDGCDPDVRARLGEAIVGLESAGAKV